MQPVTLTAPAVRARFAKHEAYISLLASRLGKKEKEAKAIDEQHTRESQSKDMEHA